MSEWDRSLELAEAELVAFDRVYHGAWFTSKDQERMDLVAAVEAARIGLLRARHAAAAAGATESAVDEPIVTREHDCSVTCQDDPFVTPLRAAVAAIWADADHVETAPIQLEVAQRLGLQPRTFENRLARHPGLWKRLTRARPSG